MTKLSALVLATGLLVGLAGCVVPEESGDEGPANDSTQDEAVTPEFIVIEGRTYECDDTFDFDGVCDGYELNEGMAGDGDAQAVTASAEGSFTLAGETYRCEDTDDVDVDPLTDDPDTAGACERYERDE